MKNTLILFFALILSIGLSAQDFPQPSPKASVSQVVGVTNITVDYSSPGVKGRRLFGELIPYGQVWRTGANKATAITFDSAVEVGGTAVRPGSYSVFTIPYEDGRMALILNSDTELYGTRNRDNSKDVASVELKHTRAKESVERMMFSFYNTSDSGTELHFAWGVHRFMVPINVATSKIVEATVNERLEEFGQQYEFYADAASYYFGQGNYEVAKKYGEISVEMSAKFWNTHTLAKIYKELGDTEKATKMAERSLELSKKAEYQPYIDRNKKLLEEL